MGAEQEMTDRPVGEYGAPTGRSSSSGRLVRIIVATLAILAGAGLIAYPVISNWINQQTQDQVSRNQQQAVESAAPADLWQQKAAAIAYNQQLLNGSSHVVDPFDGRDMRPDNEEYEQVLNLAGDGVMAQLVIPAIGVDLPVSHYTDERSLTHGVGHLVNTSVPFGGPSTHSVLAGHTGLPNAQLFDRLGELHPGDWFIIRVLGEDHAYQVSSAEVVLPDEVSALAIEAGRDLVTLVTCTPYGVNSHRLLVRAERTEIPAEWSSGDTPINRSVIPAAQAMPSVWIAVAAGAASATVILFIILFVNAARRRGRRRAC